MLKLFGTTRCRRCGSDLEHTTETTDSRVVSVWRPDARLVCPSCGFSRPVIYAYVRTVARAA